MEYDLKIVGLIIGLSIVVPACLLGALIYSRNMK